VLVGKRFTGGEIISKNFRSIQEARKWIFGDAQKLKANPGSLLELKATAPAQAFSLAPARLAEACDAFRSDNEEPPRILSIPEVVHLLKLAQQKLQTPLMTGKGKPSIVTVYPGDLIPYPAVGLWAGSNLCLPSPCVIASGPLNANVEIAYFNKVANRIADDRLLWSTFVWDSDLPSVEGQRKQRGYQIYIPNITANSEIQSRYEGARGPHWRRFAFKIGWYNF